MSIHRPLLLISVDAGNLLSSVDGQRWMEVDRGWNFNLLNIYIEIILIFESVDGQRWTEMDSGGRGQPPRPVGEVRCTLEHLHPSMINLIVNDHNTMTLMVKNYNGSLTIIHGQSGTLEHRKASQTSYLSLASPATPV